MHYKNKLLFFVISLITLFPVCYTQISVTITKPRIEVYEDQIEISYDIKSLNKSDKFKVWVEVTDTLGNIIKTRTLTGDVGKKVFSGNEKKITWDLAADRMFMDTGIYIKICAEHLNPPKIPVNLESVGTINKRKALFQSALFPGWGLSSGYNKKFHLAKGASTYGLVAASIILNRMAISNYDKYQNLEDYQKLNDYYDKSVRQDNISEICAYTALGLWASDIIWTFVKSSRHNKMLKQIQIQKLSLVPVFEPLSNTSLVGIRLRF
jgi:hypothetical protein